MYLRLELLDISLPTIGFVGVNYSSSISIVLAIGAPTEPNRIELDLNSIRQIRFIDCGLLVASLGQEDKTVEQVGCDCGMLC